MYLSNLKKNRNNSCSDCTESAREDPPCPPPCSPVSPNLSLWSKENKIPLHAPNQILITDRNNVMKWIDLCSFSGLNIFTTKTSNTTGGIVFRNTNIQCGPSCLEIIVPNATNQILMSDSTGKISWVDKSTISTTECPSVLPTPSSNSILTTDACGNIGWTDKCSINGMNINITGIMGESAGLIVKLNSNDSCLRNFLPSNPMQILINNSDGNFEFTDINCLSVGGYPVQAFPNQVLITNGMGQKVWIDQCSFAGLDINNLGCVNGNLVVKLNNPSTTCTDIQCLQTLQATNTFQMLTTDQNGNLKWIDQCTFSSMNVNVTTVFGDGVIIRLDSPNNCLRTLTPTGIDQVLVTNNSGEMTWICQKDLDVYPMSNQNQVFVTDSMNVRVWIDQCLFAGMNQTINGPVPSGGILINTLAGSDCLRTLLPGAPNSVLVTNNSGLINWETHGQYLPPGAPYQVLLTDAAGNYYLDDICDYAGISNTVTNVNPAPNVGLIVKTSNSVGDCLRTMIAGSFDTYLTTDNVGTIKWRTLPGGGTTVPYPGLNQVLVSSPIGNIQWINQCDFAGMNIMVGALGPAIGAGLLVRNGTSGNNCVNTLLPGFPNSFLTTNNFGTIQWAISVTSLTPLDGILINASNSVSSTTSIVTVGLDGWEIIDGSKILRPKTGFVGKLGDSTHIIADFHLALFNLYNGVFKQTIKTNASADFIWTTPTGNPSSLSFLTCDPLGNLSYSAPSSGTQILTSSGWIEQCTFAGLNMNSSSVVFNSGVTISGVVVNNGLAASCLRTLNPGFTVGTAKDKVLITNSVGDMTWDLQCNFAGLNNIIGSPLSVTTGLVIHNTSLTTSCLGTLMPGAVGNQLGITPAGKIAWVVPSGGTVTLINTADGITGGPITTTGVLGLDGWEIETITKTFRPKVSLTGLLGDASRIISSAHLQVLSLHDVTNGFVHNIQRSTVLAGGNTYTWITPNNNPSTKSILTCSSVGQLDYSIPTSGEQFLSSQGPLNAPLWVDQCDFGRINLNQVFPPIVNPSYLNRRSGVLVRVETPVNNSLCLWDVQPSLSGANNQVNQVLVTDASGDITWINQAALMIPPSGVISVKTSEGLLINNGGPDGLGPLNGNVVLSLDGWEITPIGKVLRPSVNLSGCIGGINNQTTNVHTVSLELHNGTTNSHSIQTSTVTGYTWITPASNPLVESIIKVSNTGIMDYLQPLPNQVLITDAFNAMMWIDQCDYAGLSIITPNPVNSNTGLVVHDTAMGADCLRTLMPNNIGDVLTVNAFSQMEWLPGATGNVTSTNVNSANQVLVSDNGSNVLWIDQCDFGYINVNQVSPPIVDPNYLNKRSGVIVRVETPSSNALCLWDVQPTLNGANNQMDQVLVTNATGDITWINQTALIPTGVTSLQPLDGILINGSDLVPSVTQIVNIGLNGWEIMDIGKVLRPKISTLGSVGDITNYMLNVDTINLQLHNGFVTHTITTNASAPYPWITPTGNPAASRLLEVDNLGNMSYSNPLTSTQVLTSQGIGNAPLWIEQCQFAGMNNTVGGPLNLNQGLVVRDTTLSANCLRTLMPGAVGTALIVDVFSRITWGNVGNVISSNINSSNQVLVTDSLNVVKWINQCDFNGINVSLSSVPAVSTACGVVVNNGGTSDCLRTVNPGVPLANMNKVFVTDPLGNMMWIPQLLLPSPSLFNASVYARTGAIVGTINNSTPIPFVGTNPATLGTPGFTIKKASISPDFTYWWIQSSDLSNGTMTVHMKLYINASSTTSISVNRARLYFASDPATGLLLGFIQSGNVISPSAFTSNNVWTGFLFETSLTLNYYGLEPASYYCMVFQTDSAAVYKLGTSLNFDPLTDISYELFLEQIK